MNFTGLVMNRDGRFLGGKVVVIATTTHADARGTLVAIAFAEHGFVPVRAFTVTAPPGSVRGGHGHRAGRQLLMHVSGEIELELRHAGAVEHVTLGREIKALLVSAPVWSRQTYRGDHPAMVVLADTPFNPGGYHDEA